MLLSVDNFQEFVKQLSLKPGQSVLDVGCGIGGSAFLMTQVLHVAVTFFVTSSV